MNEQIILDLLKMSEDEIVQELKNNNIKGYPMNAFSCPIAKYLRVKLGIEDSLRIGVTDTYIRVGLNDDEFRKVYHLSDYNACAVVNFIKNMDIGKYPELVY